MARPTKRTADEKKEQQKAAQKRYIEKLARVEITMPPERKQQIQDHVKVTGESINQFLNRAAEETIENDIKDKAEE
ncbi:MAG: hypothetical protein K5771_01720 [Oscillospiraceae bacterium]|nr:hypothetical protein [Oscillospiraceae bacterium]